MLRLIKDVGIKQSIYSTASLVESVPNSIVATNDKIKGNCDTHSKFPVEIDFRVHISSIQDKKHHRQVQGGLKHVIIWHKQITKREVEGSYSIAA